MATTTTLMCIGGNYGNSGNGAYSSSAGASVYIGPSGYNYRSRLLFPSLRASLGLGSSAIKITAVTLHMRRAEGRTTIRAGCNTSGAWGASQLGAGSGTIGSSTGWYTINISGIGEYIDDYTGNWYLHLTGSGGRARCNGFNTDWVPRVKVTWEYVANTIKTETDESTAGEPVTFNITPGANDASYTLTYKFGEETGTIAEKVPVSVGTDGSPAIAGQAVCGTAVCGVSDPSATAIRWVPPLSLATEIPNATEGTATITMTVYNASGAVLRTELVYLTINVPETVLPVIPADGIGIELVKTLGGYALTGESYANITPKIDMNGAYGATIKTLTATVTDGETVQNIPWTSVLEVDADIFGGAPLPTNVFSAAGNATVVLEVVDSRGRTVTAEAPPIPVQPYSRPVIAGFKIDRYEPAYDANEEISGYIISDIGENVWVNIQAFASSVAPDGVELNNIRWEMTSTPTTTDADGAQYSGTGDGATISITNDRSIIEDIVPSSVTVNYALTVTDGLGNVAYAYDSVAPGRANFSLAPSKYGAAFGGIAKGTEENPMLESYYPIHAYEQIHAYGGIEGYGVLAGNVLSSQISIASGANLYSPTVTIPRDGLYLMIAYGNFQGASNTTGGQRYIAIQKNGSDIASTHYPHTQGGWPTYYLPEVFPFKAGDIVRSYVQQTSGAARTCVAGLRIVQLSNAITT